MLDFVVLRELSLDAPAVADRPAHLSAASGLVQSGTSLYVIADDEHHLGIFARHGTAPGRLLRLFEGDLPLAAKERKRHKPDFEALTLLPPFDGHPHGALLALGSGSRRRRRSGVLLALGPARELDGHLRPIDLSALYGALGNEFADLNIEGAAVSGDELVLLQRGNKRHRDDAVIRYPLAPFLAALASGDALEAQRPRAIQGHELGTCGEVPLSFTDIAALPGGELVFSAVAEDTDDSYRDGACAGAAVGLIDRDGRLRALELLAEPYKIEGLHAWRDGDQLRLLAVSDADNPAVPAVLLAGAWGIER